jgi:hypothetical protein
MKPYSELTKEEKLRFGYPELPTATPLERPLQQFLKWEQDNVDYWIASEAFVVHPEKRYAGQLDAIYMSKSGRLCLCDFKFSSHISEDYSLQCAGYCAPFELYGIKFDDRVVIRLPKTLYKDEWNNVKYEYKKIPNDIEIKVLDSNYEADRDVFFHCLPVKQWVNQFTKY